MVTARSAPMVLLAAYQGEKYLPEQLTSLRAQTIPFTALLRDDGSEDATVSLLAAAAASDSRFRIAASSGQHLGAVGAFRALIREASSAGTDAALCDQDDIWHPEKLQILQGALSAAEAQYGRDTPLLVHCDGRVIDAQGNILCGSFRRHQGWSTSAVSLPKLLVQNNVTGCMLMMNAPLCRICAEYMPESGVFMHDWFIALTAAAFGHVIPVDRQLVDYRQHGSNVMGASSGGLMCRALHAFRQPARIRSRLRLSYDNAAMIRAAYGSELPQDAQQILDDFLRIPSEGKLRRIRLLIQGDFLMQSTLTRIAALLFA